MAEVDLYEYAYHWLPEKKLSWLEDLNQFVYKTLGKKKYLKPRDLRNREQKNHRTPR